MTPPPVVPDAVALIAEAREDVTMCYHPTNFSEAEFLERLDAFAAAVRRDTLAEVRAERNVSVLGETLHALGYPPIRHADARKVLAALTTMEDQ